MAERLALNRHIAKLALLVCPVLLAAFEPRRLAIAPAETALFQLDVEKTGLLSGKKHIFAFPQFAGTLQFNEQNPASSTLQLTVQTASIACLDNWVSESDRKKILKLATTEMLAVDKFPAIRFESRSIQDLGNSKFRVTGDLTIRDRTQSVIVDTSLQSAAGGLWFEGSATVKLTAFGLKPPSAALGAIGTKDAMTVRFRLRAA